MAIKKIGLVTSTTLVIGNMVGSGVFLLPASLAIYGGISLLGWIGSSVGAIFLAMLFSNLSKAVTGSAGGPYAFARAGMGDFAGFLVAWGYWISIWCTNAAISVTFVSYLSVFIPSLKTNPILAVGSGLSAVWFLTWINSKGVREAGRVQLFTTILKLTPLVAISIVGLFYINAENFTPFNISEQTDLTAITASATMTLFAFMGLESATIPSTSIIDPEKTIPKATMIGTTVTIAVYILGTVAVMGMISPHELKNSNAPFADAAAILWGDRARYWVAAGAIVSTFGALNGWILLQGQIPFAASRDNLFPLVFGRVNKSNTPVMGLVISSFLISMLMLMNFTKGLTDTFTFMILLTAVVVLVPFLFSAAAYGIIILRNKNWRHEGKGNLFIAVMAFAYSLWALIGSGQQTVYWGFIAILTGIPFYVWMKRSQE